MYGVMMSYNELKYVKQSVPLLMEICEHTIVQDNGSSDGTREYLKSLRGAKLSYYELNQNNPPDFSRLTNALMSHVPDEGVILRIAPDEFLSDTLIEMIKSGELSDGGSYMLPIYHLMHSPRECLPIEHPGYHCRIFRKTPGLKYGGNVHEQANYPHPIIRVPPDGGAAIVHFSYLEKPRLRRKSRVYSEIPGSGFNDPNDLASRLQLDAVPLPDIVKYRLEHTFAREIAKEK